MNRRDWLLHEMNIPQWVLTKPQVLKGDAQIRLDKGVKLVVVCEEQHQHTRLFGDILYTLNLKPQEYQWLNAEQSQRLTFEHEPIFCFIQPQPQLEESMKHFAKLNKKMTACQYHSWQEIEQPPQKRKLWQQMEAFCHHFDKENHAD